MQQNGRRDTLDGIKIVTIHYSPRSSCKDKIETTCASMYALPREVSSASVKIKAVSSLWLPAFLASSLYRFVMSLPSTFAVGKMFFYGLGLIVAKIPRAEE